MKAIFLPVCFLGLLTVASADEIRVQLKALDESVCAAMMKRDIGAFSAVMKGATTPDFKYFETKDAKPLTFDQMVAAMKTGLGMMTKMTIVDSKALSVKTVGDTATVLTTHHLVGMVPGADKKSHTMAFTGVSVDVFKKSGTTWKMASMTWKSQETKLDGHIQKPGKM